MNPADPIVELGWSVFESYKRPSNGSFVFSCKNPAFVIKVQ